MKTKYKIIAILGTTLGLAYANAADFGALSINADSKTFNPGDRVIESNQGSLTYLLDIRNGSTVDISDLNGGIEIGFGSSDNPLNVKNGVAVYIYNGSNVNFGSGTTVNAYVDDIINMVGVQVVNSTFRVEKNLTIVMHGNSTSIHGFSVSSGGYADLGQNAYINAPSRAISIISNGSELVATTASINAVGDVGMGVYINAGKATLYDSAIYGNMSGISFSNATAAAGTSAEVNIIGGTVKSTVGAAIETKITGGANQIVSVLNISGGAKVSSESGVLYNERGAGGLLDQPGSLHINVEGAGTVVEGRVDNQIFSNFEFAVKDYAKWTSTGPSSMNKLVLDNANIEFTLTNMADAIIAGDMSTSGMSDVVIDFSNDFLNDITDGFVFDTNGVVIIGRGEKDNINYIVLGQNKEGSTWDAINNGDGSYTINNINVVPEPSTYAVIFGVLALALSVYRKRK